MHSSQSLQTFFPITKKMVKKRTNDQQNEQSVPVEVFFSWSVKVPCIMWNEMISKDIGQITENPCKGEISKMTFFISIKHKNFSEIAIGLREYDVGLARVFKHYWKYHLIYRETSSFLGKSFDH